MGNVQRIPITTLERVNDIRVPPGTNPSCRTPWREVEGPFTSAILDADGATLTANMIPTAAKIAVGAANEGYEAQLRHSETLHLLECVETAGRTALSQLRNYNRNKRDDQIAAIIKDLDAALFPGLPGGE